MRKILLIAVVLITAAPIAVIAHEGATGMVKMRMDAMSSIAKNMKAIGAALKNGQTDDGQALAGLAKQIADHAAVFPSHFKDDKQDPISEATPAVWEQPEKFKELSDALASYGETFADLALTGASLEALNSEFGKMAGTCKACHEVYRAKK